MIHYGAISIFMICMKSHWVLELELGRFIYSKIIIVIYIETVKIYLLIIGLISFFNEYIFIIKT